MTGHKMDHAAGVYTVKKGNKITHRLTPTGGGAYSVLHKATGETTTHDSLPAALTHLSGKPYTATAIEDEVEDKIEAETEEATVELADVVLASVVNKDEELSLLALADDKVALLVGDNLVATMTDAAPNFDLLATVTYQRQLEAAVKKVGMVAALEGAGFTLVTIKADAALANAGKVAEDVVASSLQDQALAHANRLKNCMDVVAAGAIRGLFAKSGAGELAASIEAELAALNIGNPKAITVRILSKALPGYSNGLLESAHSLSDKSDEYIASLRDQIADMDDTAFDYKKAPKPEQASVADEVEDVLATKLARPARTSVSASSESAQPKNRFAGLFTK